MNDPLLKRGIFKPFQANVSFLYHVKTSENQRCIEIEHSFEMDWTGNWFHVKYWFLTKKSCELFWWTATSTWSKFLGDKFLPVCKKTKLKIKKQCKSDKICNFAETGTPSLAFYFAFCEIFRTAILWNNRSCRFWNILFIYRFYFKSMQWNSWKKLIKIDSLSLALWNPSNPTQQLYRSSR